MDINVTIKCPDIVLAAESFARALFSIRPTTVETVNPETDKAVMQTSPGTIPTVPYTAAVPTSPGPAVPVTENTSSAAAVPTTPAPTITGDMVAKAGADLIAANPGAFGPLNALLQKYGVGCAQELRPDQIGPFATEMRALGARL